MVLSRSAAVLLSWLRVDRSKELLEARYEDRSLAMVFKLLWASLRLACVEDRSFCVWPNVLCVALKSVCVPARLSLVTSRSSMVALRVF